MGDFLLDLREQSRRGTSLDAAADAMRTLSGAAVFRFETPQMALLLSVPGRPDLWSPAVHGREGHRVVTGLAGRVAFEEIQWREALADRRKDGGAACRIVAEQFRQRGMAALEELNGNFAAIVFDEAAGSCHLVTDRAGVLLCYANRKCPGGSVMSSHPDLLATATGIRDDLDEDSLKAFIVTGGVPFPGSYYRPIRALPWATAYRFSFGNGRWTEDAPHRYFEPTPRFDPAVRDGDLAEELADALHHATRLRSLPVLGTTAVGASGGMDSRAILSFLADAKSAVAFTLVDEPNLESRIAGKVAEAAGVRHTLVRRSFDYYGEAAEEGARIGAGTGCLASNHFLGLRDWFAKEGVDNFLTGCYCDYLFKGLALNTHESRWLRRQQVTTPAPEFYRPRFPRAVRRDSRDRPGETRPGAGTWSEDELFAIECERVFPLAGEGDCAQRMVSQRIFPWYAVMADTGLLSVFERIRPSAKLNGGIFREMLRVACDARMLRIPTSNNGAPVTAGPLVTATHRYRSALLNRWNSRRGMVSRGSWPNWEHYLRTSKLVRDQWEQTDREAAGILEALVAPGIVQRPVSAFHGREVELFQRLWTLKLWLGNRLSAGPSGAASAETREPLEAPGVCRT
ncbi:MAG: hypothetical protein HKN82_09435 [Akkermansiaceae bacterium]|nr:hypothetical protein [Akkermansiaceae bacterium]